MGYSFGMMSAVDPNWTGTALASAITEPVLRDLLEHWVEARGPRPMPTRGCIDPTRIPGCLPHLWIYRRGEDGEFTCILSGEEIRMAWGQPIVDKPAASFLGPDYQGVVKSRWNKVLNGPAIQHGMARTDDQFKHVERLVLPVADAEGRPVQVLGGSIYRFDRQFPTDKPVLPATRSASFYDTRTLELIA